MRPLLVGEQNPYGRDPRYALYPEPPNSAGGRLCRLVMGLTVKRYISLFDRVNLCAGNWSAREARETALRLRGESSRAGDARVTVLLGKRVCTAFERPFEPFTTNVGTCDVVKFVVLPHPSGLSRAWNEPGAHERARAVLREAGVLPLPAPGSLEPVECMHGDRHCSNCGAPTVKNVCAECGYDVGSTRAP